MLHAAHEVEVGVPHQHARQQPRLARHLEAVADGQHPAAARRVSPHGGHHGRTRRYGAAAEVVAVGEAARQHREIGAGGQNSSRCARRARRLDAPEARRSARATSRSRLTPGKTMIGRLHASAPPAAVERDGIVLDHRVGEQRLAHLLRAPPRRSARTEPSSTTSKILPCRTLVTPTWPSEWRAPSIALPWGSRTPDFSVTEIRACMGGCLTAAVDLPWIRRGGHAEATAGGTRRFLAGARTCQEGMTEWPIQPIMPGAPGRRGPGMHPDLIVFDCDGVLVDSEVLSISGVVAVLNDAGVSATYAMIARYFGLKQADIMLKVSEETGQDIPLGTVGAHLARHP